MRGRDLGFLGFLLHGKVTVMVEAHSLQQSDQET